MKIYLPSTFIITYARAKMIVHAFMIVLDQLDYNYIPRKEKENVGYIQDQWRDVLLWKNRFWQSSVQRGWHTKLCMTRLLNGLSKFAQSSVGFLNLLSTHAPKPHCCLGKLPL